jgi:hypothetical protein
MAIALRTSIRAAPLQPNPNSPWFSLEHHFVITRGNVADWTAVNVLLRRTTAALSVLGGDWHVRHYQVLVRTLIRWVAGLEMKVHTSTKNEAFGVNLGRTLDRAW